MANNNYSHASGGAVYGLGIFGALFYYLGSASTIGAGIIGVIKSFLWPGFLVYELLRFLGA